MKHYDVIIAGAGPAGAQCARYIAENSNYSVILLDRTHKLGYPKKSTAGTFNELIDPFFAEGIRQAMFSGLFAAQVAINALKLNNTSAEQLKEYDSLWNNKYPKIYRLLNSFMSKLFYRMSNARFDKLIHKMDKIDQDTRDRFINYRYTLRDVISILPFF